MNHLRAGFSLGNNERDIWSETQWQKISFERVDVIYADHSLSLLISF